MASMEPTESSPQIQVGSCENGVCDGCGKSFTRGGAIRETDGLALIFLCQWCICLWLDTITGHEVTNQVLAWEAARGNTRLWRQHMREVKRKARESGDHI